MPSASTTNHLIDSLYEVALSGTGIRPITSGYYDSEQWWEEKVDDLVSINAIVKPQIKIQITDTSKLAHQSPSNRQLFKISILVEVAYNTDSPYVKNQRIANEKLVASDGLNLVQAFTYPNNLEFTSGGSATGLVSGQLEYIDSKMQYRYSKKLIRVSHRFSGIFDWTSN